MATVGSTAAQETTGTLVTARTCGKPCCRKDVNNSGDATRAGEQATAETTATTRTQETLKAAKASTAAGSISAADATGPSRTS
jgi:hypothetical protein